MVRKILKKKRRTFPLVLAAAAAILLFVLFVSTDEPAKPPAAMAVSPERPLASRERMIEDNLAAGRVAWYPFTREPDGPFPTLTVRMTQEEAKEQFLSQFSRYVRHVMEDDDELPYFRNAAAFFIAMSHRHDPVRLSAVDEYRGSASMSIHPSLKAPGLATIDIHMPLWKETEDLWVEEAARDDFFIALTHEFEHFAEGYWRDDREHSATENIRTEALTWGKTCDLAVFPLLVRGRWVHPNTRESCAFYDRLGRDASAPAFIAHIGSDKASVRH